MQREPDQNPAKSDLNENRKSSLNPGFGTASMTAKRRRRAEEDAVSNTDTSEGVKRIRRGQSDTINNRPGGTSSNSAVPANSPLTADTQQPGSARTGDRPDMVSTVAGTSTVQDFIDVDALYERQSFEESDGPTMATRASSTGEARRENRTLVPGVQGRFAKSKGTSEKPIDVDEQTIAPSGWNNVFDRSPGKHPSFPEKKNKKSKNKNITNTIKKQNNIANKIRKKKQTVYSRDQPTIVQTLLSCAQRNAGESSRGPDSTIGDVSDSEGKMQLASELGLTSGNQLVLTSGKTVAEPPSPGFMNGGGHSTAGRVSRSKPAPRQLSEYCPAVERPLKPDIPRDLDKRETAKSRNGRRLRRYRDFI